jgi:hypothetical protein
MSLLDDRSVDLAEGSPLGGQDTRCATSVAPTRIPSVRRRAIDANLVPALGPGLGRLHKSGPTTRGPGADRRYLIDMKAASSGRVRRRRHRLVDTVRRPGAERARAPCARAERHAAAGLRVIRREQRGSRSASSFRGSKPQRVRRRQPAQREHAARHRRPLSNTRPGCKRRGSSTQTASAASSRRTPEASVAEYDAVMVLLAATWRRTTSRSDRCRSSSASRPTSKAQRRFRATEVRLGAGAISEVDVTTARATRTRSRRAGLQGHCGARRCPVRAPRPRLPT